MKMLSYNIRGLGDGAKRRVIREVVCQNQIEFLCIQETKAQVVDRRVCAQLWADSDFDWRVVPAVNRRGGILCIWKVTSFAIHDCVEGPGFLCLVGSWVSSQHRCAIVNIYSSGSLEDRLVTWNALRAWRVENATLPWCIGGDFNAACCPEERRGTTGISSSQRREMMEFNSFIYDLGLLDLPLAGKKFTWFRPNNQAQSRLDRFLVSVEWNDFWPKCSQLVLDRNISDHCPIMLRQQFDNWGPKPFRVLKRSPALPGGAGFLGRVSCPWLGSVRLKGEIKRFAAEIERLEFYRVRESENSQGFTGPVLHLHESLLCQKARSKWVAQGDQNTSFFHSSINWKRKSNSIVGLLIDGVWNENPDCIKVEVQRFFEQRFKASPWSRPRVDGVNSPHSLNEFRPISLIGCIYKVVSKLLATRLKSVIGKLIDERQFAFIGRPVYVGQRGDG
ncbi:uncharacterized protein LOC130736879 [Lotus japonicus]|uniref:uncharacterized protein LOC130736879 n=1 Tax=Lotus japonicus TaxID=34305 RepID=UPI0025896855|nr:uncharacterized protein LOC130736879 [Lotus japonicus]